MQLIHPRIVSKLLPSLVTLFLIEGCVTEISSEERLERATRNSAVEDSTSAAELSKIHCKDTADRLAKARSENTPETERLSSYMALYQSLKKRTSSFEEAMKRNPDLTYQPGSQDLVSAHDVCVQQTADVKVEFDRYVRELVSVPTVQEVKGGNTVTVARLDFDVLRGAIDVLRPEDRESLLAQVTAAGKKVDSASPKRIRR